MLIIDRFESDYAICESDAGEVVSIPRQSIESCAKEGDSIVSDADGFFTVDKISTRQRSKRFLDLLKKLFFK